MPAGIALRYHASQREELTMWFKTPEHKLNREETHRPDDDHGKVVTPYREVPSDAGWLACPLNRDKYTGENAGWRE
jgi:hypothetical protein